MAIEGLVPLAMNTHRDRWEVRDGKPRRMAEPDDARERAALRLSLDEAGRPALGWRELLWRLSGCKGWFDTERARRSYGLAIEGGGLVVDGEWEPQQKAYVGAIGFPPRVYTVPVFPAWRAAGVIAYEPSLWTLDDLRHAFEGAGVGFYRLGSWASCDARGGAA